jgi:hypothetical protein
VAKKEGGKRFSLTTQLQPASYMHTKMHITTTYISVGTTFNTKRIPSVRAISLV